MAVTERKGYTDLSREEETALLDQIRKRFDYATAAWEDIRDEGRKDMLCVAGQIWDAMDPKGKGQREEAKRPMLSLDELGQYTNQLVNKVRANPRGVKFSPTGNGASEKTAEFYQNKVREIEYRSNAQMVFTTAFENTVQRSYGACRVNTRYARPDAFEQELWLEAFPNPDLVTPDPDILSPVGADMKFCFVHELWDIEDFKTTWPDAKITDFKTLNADYPTWVRGEKIMLAEYWVVKTTRRRLVEFKALEGQVPVRKFADELEAAGVDVEDETVKATIANSRSVDEPKVCQYLTNGVEILEFKEWPGKYIPIVLCLGKVLYVSNGSQTEKKILSLVRLARDPMMLYCYYRTAQAEVVGMTPKTPYMAYKGQFSPEQMLEVQRSLHEPVAVLEANATIDGLPSNQPLPLPTRQPYIPEIERLELGAEGARRAIQAAMGSAPLPTSAQRRNEKSGKALEKIDESIQLGNFHFEDHFNDMIQQVGVIEEDLMDRIYDSAREVAVLKRDDTPELVRINDLSNPEAIPTKGQHLVTISTGPSYDSEREAASEFADNLIASPLMELVGPEKAQKILSLAIKMKNVGPIGDEIASVISPAPDADADPAQLAQKLSETMQQLQQVAQAAEQMKQQLETDAAKQQATIEKARLDAHKAIALERMKASTAIATAKIQAASKLEDTARQGAIDVALQEMEQAFEAAQKALDREHAEEMAEYRGGADDGGAGDGADVLCLPVVS